MYRMYILLIRTLLVSAFAFCPAKDRLLQDTTAFNDRLIQNGHLLLKRSAIGSVNEKETTVQITDHRGFTYYQIKDLLQSIEEVRESTC